MAEQHKSENRRRRRRRKPKRHHRSREQRGQQNSVADGSTGEIGSRDAEETYVVVYTYTRFKRPGRH